MIDWLIEQQSTLCIALTSLIILERFFTSKIGITLTYKLWLLVPLTLGLNSLPQQIVALPSGALSRYVVGLKPATIELSQLDSLWSMWLFGVLIIAAVLSVNYIKISRSISQKPRGTGLTYYSQVASTPMLFGFITPKVLLPTNFETAFCQEQQRLVLEHEETHYRHRDHLWNSLALTIAIVFWFNPLVWLALRSFRINQELACDYAVLENKSNPDKLLYAKALVQCATQPSTNLTLYTTFGDKNTMFKRLQLIKKPAAASKTISAASIIIAAAFMANTALANLSEKSVDMSKVNLATPVKRIAPVYPTHAAENNTQGYVILQFDITEAGKTDNIAVLESSPTGVFDKSAVVALSKWQYKPQIKKGKALRQTGLLVQLDYLLDGQTVSSTSTSQVDKSLEKIKVAKN